jgi:hypothetical protein
MASLTRYIGRAALRLILLAQLLVLALATCGAQAQGSSAALAGEAPALDSCALLTQADAEALLGAPVAAPTPTGPTPATLTTRELCHSASITRPGIRTRA